MPEGPEVHGMVSELENKFKGARLNSIIIHGGRYSRHGPPNNFKELNKSLPLKILKMNCKGKFIYFCLDEDWTIWMTLGLTGHYRISQTSPGKHAHLEFKTSKGTFWFEDMRNFGTLSIYHNKNEELQKKLDKLGVDPITESNQAAFEKWVKRLKKRGEYRLGDALIDQTVNAGVGNYLRSEISYAAHVNPLKKVKELNDNELKLIWNNMTKIMKNNLKLMKKGGIPKVRGLFKIYERKETDKGEQVHKTKMKDGRYLWHLGD